MFDHFHRYAGKAYDGYSVGAITVSCLHEDCYRSIDRKLYPPELIGPKLRRREDCPEQAGP